VLRVKLLRVTQERTQTDLGEAAGVSQTFITAVEHKRINPRPKEVMALARALRFEGDPAKLLDEVGK
jgi:predicted transcriptional regulator